MKVYISGPVTGLPENNKQAFQYYADRLESVGFETITPTSIVPEGTDWHGAMRLCISAMMDADIVIMLSGWPHSKGAIIEHRIARELEIPVLYTESI